MQLRYDDIRLGDGCSRAIRDFLGMLHALEKVVTVPTAHPEAADFKVCISVDRQHPDGFLPWPVGPGVEYKEPDEILSSWAKQK